VAEKTPPQVLSANDVRIDFTAGDFQVFGRGGGVSTTAIPSLASTTDQGLIFKVKMIVELIFMKSKKRQAMYC